jgi:hypothetical protein
METRSIPPRPDVAIATTSARVTPTPPRASRFGEVLSNTVVRSAESAMRVLPGSPMMAVAVRGAGGPGSLAVPMTPASSTRGPEGPTTSTTRPGVPGAGLDGLAPVAPAVTGTDGVGIESALQQSQDMNLYYLQVQEAVNAQNRSFTTLSNVLKAQHDTVKTAIGNIR